MARLKYKLVAYKLWDGEVLSEEQTNNKAYLENKLYKNYANYRHELYERVGNKWQLIASK